MCIERAHCPCEQSTGEHSTAQEMLERALYAFEMSWHHAFNPATANVLLDFDHEPNKVCRLDRL